MVCWDDGETDDIPANECYHATAAEGSAMALFDTGCAITCVGERTLEALKRETAGFVLRVEDVQLADATRIRFGAGEAVVAMQVATLALKFPAFRGGVPFALSGTLRAHVVPGSGIPLLLSIGSIQAAFDTVGLKDGIVRWTHDSDVTVQMERRNGPHWMLPVYVPARDVPGLGEKL